MTTDHLKAEIARIVPDPQVRADLLELFLETQIEELESWEAPLGNSIDLLYERSLMAPDSMLGIQNVAKDLQTFLKEVNLEIANLKEELEENET